MMKVRRVLVTSVVRHADFGHTSGYARVIDCERGRVVRSSPVCESVHRHRDVNPRGGLRGARGVAALGEQILIANAESVMVFDRAWRCVDQLTHPLMGGVHDLLPESDGIWITCTSCDLLIKLDWNGGLLDVWDWRRDHGLTQLFGLSRLCPVDQSQDYRDPESTRTGVRNTVHLNAVSPGLEGYLLLFGRVLNTRALQRRKISVAIGKIASVFGIKPRRRSMTQSRKSAIPSGRIEGSSSAIVSLDPDGTARVLHRVNGLTVPNHNILFVDGLLVYNDSNAGRVVAVRPDPCVIDHSVEIPGSPSFVRGLARVGTMEFLVGNQAPLALYHVDLERGRIVRSILIDGDTNESLYGICVLPDQFDDPPDRFACI